MTFSVGQKIACVDDRERVSMRLNGWFERFRKFHRLHHNLNEGDVYTVIGVKALKCTNGEYVEVLRVHGAWHFGHPEIGFPSFQFRPLIERKAKISFTANAPKDSEKWDNRKRVKVRA